MKKSRITLQQVAAILALLGILLGVVGTAWLGTQPATPVTVETLTVPENVAPVVPDNTPSDTATPPQS